MRIERYTLNLNLSEKEGSFHGEEKISLTGEGEKLVLDAESMKIIKVDLNGREVDYQYDGKNLTVSEVINGPTDLSIDYDGEYSVSLRGLYLAKTGDTKMITTQFESTGARLVFPCIDNPGYKAEFDLSLIIDSNDEAISNMPKKGESFSGGFKRVEFEITPRMSTYLLYIGVGQFDHIRKPYKNKELILTAPKGMLHSTEEPLDAAAKIIDYYEKYFDLEYQLPKMHLISVPEFAAGAMENWGAITFREAALVINENTGTFSRAYIFMVIGHEIAHQWFGDLVTMRWWDDLWLNESFANFMGYKSINQIYSELDMWALYFSVELTRGFVGDSLKSTHPIHVSVKDPESIEQIFDEISYNKGGSILKMIESFMGPLSFRDGIRDYLKTYSYSNASSEDLWSALDSHSDYDIVEIMKSWIELPGHPVVYVKKNGNKLSLLQKTFKFLGSFEDALWKIPITIVRNSGNESFLLEKRSGEIPSEGFIKLNQDTAGFYRCYYDNELFKGIVDNKDKLSPFDIWGLVTDNYSFLLSGDLDPDTYISRLNQFMDRDDALVIRTITSQLLSITNILDKNDSLRKKAIEYLRSKRNVLGDHKEDEHSGISITRESVLNALATLDREYDAEIYQKVNELDSVEPDLRQSILYAYAFHKNDPDLLIELLKKAETDEDKTKIIGALGFVSGPENIEKAMSSLDSGLVKAQDAPSLYFSLCKHSSGRDYIFENFNSIYEYVKTIFAGTYFMSAMVELTFPELSFKDKGRALALLDTVKDPAATSGASKAREYIEIYGKLRESFS